MRESGSEVKVNQFARPHGWPGRVVGYVMAIGNADMERAAVGMIGSSPTDAVLEIGFGPGVGIRRLARQVTGGLVAGVDPSEVMVMQAQRRNRVAVRDGRVELANASAAKLPFGDARFDAVMSVNNIQEWPSLDEGLTEIGRVLKPAGRLAIAVHAWVDKYAQDRGDPRQPWADHIAARAEHAGFVDLHREQRRARSGRALYFRARRTA